MGRCECSGLRNLDATLEVLLLSAEEFGKTPGFLRIAVPQPGTFYHGRIKSVSFCGMLDGGILFSAT